MFSEEILSKARAVDITVILARLGIYPVKKHTRYWVYLSPLRDEKTGSFTVYIYDNRYYDYGYPTEGKNVIDLVQKLYKYSFKEAVELLIGTEFPIVPIPSFVGQNSENEGIKQVITEIRTLQNPLLIKYCDDRAISFPIASKWLSEVYYSYKGKLYFGVGFKNDLGGYVTRNALMKHPNNIGSAGIKTIKSANTQSLSIFEGYFDFLSAIEHYCYDKPFNNVIVLNSVSNLKQAFPLILQASKVNLFLDNDAAGRKAVEAIKATGKTVTDYSPIYATHKDFNEFLIASRKPP